MTARCSLFLTTPKLDPDDFEDEDAFMEAALKDVHNSFQLAMDLIQYSADKDGIDLNEFEDEENVAGWKEKREITQAELEQTPISTLAREYVDLGHNWLKTCSKSLKDLGENLKNTAMMDLPDRNPEQDALEIRDALEVIPYYLHQIYVKLMRAQTDRDEDDAWFEENDFPKDSDGSTKVALIGIDHSILAWGTVLQQLPEQEDVILPILSRLEQLRGMVETAFPEARAFKRPGLDTE